MKKTIEVFTRETKVYVRKNFDIYKKQIVSFCTTNLGGLEYNVGDGRYDNNNTRYIEEHVFATEEQAIIYNNELAESKKIKAATI